MRASSILRIRIITGVLLFIALVLILRLYQVQVLHARAYRDEANKQYVHTASNVFNRGSIYFTTKDGEEVTGATLKVGYILAIDPVQIKNIETTYTALSALTPIDKDDFIKRAGKHGDTYEVIATKIPEDITNKIKSLKLPGVRLYQDQWRYYPTGPLESNVVGFVGYDGDNLTGRYGLERYYNDRLERNQKKVSVNFFAEIFGNLGVFNFDTKAKQEADVVTTIEPSVSRALDAELTAIHEKVKSKLTGGIIMDPKTGAIIAMSIVPGFDPNNRTDADIARFRNPLVEDFYEMGSIIKPLTVASGLDANVITPDTTYFDAGRLDMDGYTIYNFDKRGRGTVPMQEILNQSLNTGVAFIQKQLGKKAFRDYFTELGLGTETGIDLPNETHGRIDNLNSPRDVEYATASFGQGIAMTPIETIRALAALSNGGLLVTPHVVKKIRFTDGTEQEISQPDPTRVWKESTSETISRMLTTVVDKALRKGAKKNEHYSVAAKTGTAQIANPKGGGYYDDRYLHSFFGYFPSYDPKFIVFMFTVEPQGVKYASETLTDPFINMSHFLINYYNIPPDR